MEDTLMTYYFPETITSPDYEFRKMTIGIYKLETFLDAWDKMKEKAEKVGQEILASGGTISVTTLEEITKAMDGKIVTTITLPVPNELTDIANHSWSVDTGFIKMAGDALNSKMFKGMADDVLSKAANAMSVSKVQANPGYFQNYSGSAPRYFSFSFTFIPNSQEEANELIRIITVLKKFSSPTKAVGGTVLVAPNFFHLEFGNPKLNKLTNIRPCVLQSIDVNYSGSGYLETTLDGMPKHLIMSLTFAEIRSITNEDWVI